MKVSMGIQSLHHHEPEKPQDRVRGFRAAHVNLSVPELVEQAIRLGEGQLSADGALVVDTGTHTGRSPQDKFIVRDSTTETSVWWDNNAAISPEAFDLLLSDMLAHAANLHLYQQDLQGEPMPRTVSASVS